MPQDEFNCGIAVLDGGILASSRNDPPPAASCPPSQRTRGWGTLGLLMSARSKPTKGGPAPRHLRLPSLRQAQGRLFAKNAKDRAPTMLVMPARSKAWATRSSRERLGQSPMLPLMVTGLKRYYGSQTFASSPR